MSTSSQMPTISRKKRVPSKYNPNTYRVVAYDENDEPTRYPEVPASVREVDPLGEEVNKRPDMFDHSTHVLPYDLSDYRSNRPHTTSCGFLRLNSHTLNEPVCCVGTKCQPTGHWIAPQLPPGTNPPKTYKFDTVFRKDYCDTQYEIPEDNAKQHSSLKSFHLNNLKEDGVNVKEKISYEHCYNSRTDPNYPLRAKRHGTFVWSKMPPDATNEQS